MMRFVQERMFVLGNPVVVFRLERSIGSLDGFRLEASKAGVKIAGEPLLLESHEELDDFALAMSQAWTEHRKLVPKLEL